MAVAERVMNNKRIFLSSPTMNGTEQTYVDEAIRDNMVIPLGPNVNGFEKSIKEYMGAKSAVALSSGTAAMHLALKLAGLKPGEVVFCQSLTFSASANPITYEQGVPVFIDSEEDTWNMSPTALERAFEKYPECRIVIVVHIFGVPGKIDEIKAVCDRHGAILIEDAAEALGAKYKGHSVGTDGKYGILSFNGNKIITTSGGGMLLTDNEKDAQRALFWATQSRDDAAWYQHSEIGYNYRMSNICAGIGRGQMNTIDEFIAKKRRLFDIYTAELSGVADIQFQPCEASASPSRWLSTAVGKFDFMKLVNGLAEENIEARPMWKPMHLQPVFSQCDYVTEKDGVSISDKIFENGICLPSDIKNTDEDMDRIIECVKRLIK